MATSIGLYAPVLLPGEPLFLTEKPDRPQSTGLQRVGHNLSGPECTEDFFFACGSSAPVKAEHEGATAAWLAGTLAAPNVQGHGLPLLQELWPYQSLFSSLLYLVIRKPLWPVFLHSSARSGARGLPCLGSFSVVWRIRHIEGSPFAGVLLCRSEHQSLKGAPWVGSYPEVPWVRHLMGQPLFFSCRCWRVGKERLW